MILKINGTDREFSENIGIPELLGELDLHPSTVLVEHNDRALFRHEWASVQLKGGDQIEIIRVVAGG